MNSQVLSPRVQMPEGSSLGWKLSSRKWRNSLWGWGLSGQIWTRKASGLVLVGKWLTWVISSGNALIGNFLAWVAGRAEERKGLTRIGEMNMAAINQISATWRQLFFSAGRKKNKGEMLRKYRLARVPPP